MKPSYDKSVLNRVPERFTPRSRNERAKLGHAQSAVLRVTHEKRVRKTEIIGFDVFGEAIWRKQGARAFALAGKMKQSGKIVHRLVLFKS